MTTDYEPRQTPPAEPAPAATLPNEQYYRRNEQARRWGALLLLVGVVWLVFAVAARGPLFGFGFVERSEPLPLQRYTAERVVVIGVGDKIELVPAAGDEVLLEGERHAFGWNGGAADNAMEQLEIFVEDNGETLQIEVRRPNISAFGRAPYAELRLALPADTITEARVVNGDIVVDGVRGELVLASVNGDISGNESAGALTVTTTSGDVSISEHTGPFVADSTSGDIFADGSLESPRVTTVSGDIELDGSRGLVEARSISGDLVFEESVEARLNLESTSGDIEFEGGLERGTESSIANISGDVRVRLDDPESLRLEINTTSGELDTELPLSSENRERRTITGTVGSGETVLTITTTSGDVAVRGE